MYPKGQLALLLDQSEDVNPSTPLGRFYTDLFQIFYVSYYVWGYLPLVILGYRYIKAWRSRDGDSANKALAQTKLYLTGWLFAFLLIFVLNTSLPAASPRLHLKTEYVHRLEGFGLAKMLIGMATEDTSFGSFPSGHFAESMISGIFLLQIYMPAGILVVFSSVMIGLATQILRYHYFADLVGAGLVIPLALCFGHCITPGIFKRETARIMASYVAETNESQGGEIQSIELQSQSSTPTTQTPSEPSLDDASPRESVEVDLLEDHTPVEVVDLEAGIVAESLPTNTRVNAFL